jgi:hypothetical protein
MDNMLLFFIEDEFCLALFNPEELVYRMVDLVSNFLSSLKAHHNQLSILTSEQNLPEIIVLQCLLLDVSNIACHSGTSLGVRLAFAAASATGRSGLANHARVYQNRIEPVLNWFADGFEPPTR